MKISHSEIETCRKSPRAWIAQKIKSEGGGPRTGYDGAIKLAIYRFHKTLDTIDARRYLEKAFGSYGLTSSTRITRAVGTLNAYIGWYYRASPIVVGYKLLLDFDLGSGWRLGGLVSRADLDQNTGGYHCVLLGSAPRDWRDQLRMPLVQRALADKLQRPETDISVGFQNLDGTSIELVSYPQTRLDEAERDARRLVQEAAKEWRRLGGGA